MSTPVPGCAAAIAGATSPSRIKFTFAPASRSSAIRSLWRSRSSTTTEISRVETLFVFATACTFSVGDALISTTSIPCGPTAIFSMYTAAPGKNIEPRSATAITAIAFGWPSAVRRVPSSGSTATSTSAPLPLPTSSPLKSIGASSFSPSPMTTTPSIETVSSIRRIASTAAWSALSLSPRPIHRAAPIAAASVTRTSSSARFRSGGLALTSTRGTLHPFGRLDSDEIEAARDDALRGAHELQPERFGLRADDAMLVVEAMKVVGDPDGIDRDRMRCTTLCSLCDDEGELQEPFDQVPLLLRELHRSVSLFAVRVTQDAGDPRVCVLDVVDGVLLRALGGELDVDVDRLVVSPRDEVPARRVDTDLVDQLVEEDDIPAAFRDLLGLPALDDVHELVDQDFDPLRVVA